MKYNFTDDNYYYKKSFNDIPRRPQYQSNNNKKKFPFLYTLIISVIVLSFLYDLFFPNPSTKTTNEVLKIKQISKEYNTNINSMSKAYLKAIKLIPKSKKTYNKEIVTILKNWDLKNNYHKELVKLVIVQKDRFSDEIISQDIKLFYEINDSEKIKEITKYYNTIILLKTRNYNHKQARNIYYKDSLLKYNKLMLYYKKHKNTKKQTIINTMKTTIVNNFSKYQKQLKTRDYTNMAFALISLEETYKLFDELDSQEKIVLKDMDIKFYVQLGRTSWHYNYDSEYDYVYKLKQLTRVQYELIMSNPGAYARKYANPSEHENYNITNREFWINDSYQKYYHKYLIIKDSKISQSDWIKVNEDYFFKNKNNIKKVIYLKAYGDFKSENTSPLTSYKDSSRSNNYGGYSSYSGGYGGNWGGIFYTYHNPYSTNDTYRYKKRKRLRDIGGSNMSRGPSGGGK